MIPFSESIFCQEFKSEKIIEFNCLVQKLFRIYQYLPASPGRLEQSLNNTRSSRQLSVVRDEKIKTNGYPAGCMDCLSHDIFKERVDPIRAKSLSNLSSCEGCNKWSYFRPEQQCPKFKSTNCSNHYLMAFIRNVT